MQICGPKSRYLFTPALGLILTASAFAQTVKPAPAGSPGGPTPAPTSPEARSNADGGPYLGLRFDCLHSFNIDKGATQNCLAISGLRISVPYAPTPAVRGLVRLDPFATPRPSREDTPLRDDLPTAADSALGIIDFYELDWLPRPNLQVAIESYGGAARLPSVSGLSLANSLADSGWRQTALTIAYNLSFPTAMHVKFAAGDGEAETVRSVTPQQYFGFEADARIISGVRAVLGVSLNGNDAGTEEDTYLAKRNASNCGVAPPVTPTKLGHSMQRVAAGVVLDGTLPGAEGLRAAAGWQRNLGTDLDKHHSSSTVSQLEKTPKPCRVDVDTVFPEADEDVINQVRRTTYDVSANYRIFGTYFLAADYTHRNVDTGGVPFFTTCGGFVDGVCQSPDAVRSNILQQDAVTVGGGLELAAGLVVTLEYMKASYDKAYSQAFYNTQNNKTSNSLEVFNARLAYNWR